jgi:hypothetical protein
VLFRSPRFSGGNPARRDSHRPTKIRYCRKLVLTVLRRTVKRSRYGQGKREVDFIIARDRKPWMLVEAKTSDERLSPSLAHFQEQTGAPHAFQLVLDADYVAEDCFAKAGKPLVVPARTFLSQLL